MVKLMINWLCICHVAKCHTQVDDITMAFKTVFVSQVTTFNLHAFCK